MQPTLEIWLVTGMPGAGKTTVATALAARFDRGVHIPGDGVHDMIVGGRVEPDGAPADEAERQIALSQRNLCMLARSYGDAGFVPVVDWVVRGRPDLETFLEGLRGRGVRLAVLEPGSDALASRKPDAVKRFAYLGPTMERDLGGMGLHVDSGNISAGATVEWILSRRNDALIKALP